MTPEEFYYTTRPVLEAGRVVSFHASGGSMRPFISDGDTVCVKADEVYRKGDIVLCMTEDCRVVLHYIVTVRAGVCTLMGAANLRKTERCVSGAIIGKVVAPSVGRVPLILWHAFLPLRRYLLWLSDLFMKSSLR